VADLGVLKADANTNRIVATPAPLLTNLTDFPARISAGTNPGITATTFTISLVSSFGSPPVGTVEILTSTGGLNWAAADIITHGGKRVYFQRQAFFFSNESNGSLGVIGTDDLVLNPIPKGASGQKPLLRFGSREYLQTVEVTSFGTPVSGTVEWHRTTGDLNLNTTDLVTFAGQSLFYDGVALGTFNIPSTGLGTINSPSTVSFTDEAEDIFFRIPSVVQFPQTLFVDALTAGKKGQVQIRRGDGQVKFSDADIGSYTGQTVHVVRPDITLENGHALRFYRSPVDPGNTDSSVKDFTAIYTSTGALLADPIIGSPFVFLPAVPRTDLPVTVRVEQGTGSFVGTLTNFDAPSPPAGKGFVLDLNARQLAYAERKVSEVLAAPIKPFGSIQLPSYPVFKTNLVLELEDNAGLGDWQTLVLNQDFVIDHNSGTVVFTLTDGILLVEGLAATSGSVLTATGVNFPAEGATIGDFLIVASGLNEGVYDIIGVTTTTLTVTPAFPSVIASGVPYEVRGSKEILADRFFREIPKVDPNTSVERLNSIGVASNGPRLSINAAVAGRSRFRFDKLGGFSTTVLQPNNGAFTAPGSLAAGTVEISLTTGNLNFSTADLGKTIYWALKLNFGVEYTLQAGLGFIEFTDRLLGNEEVFIQYSYLDDSGNKVPVAERGAISVTKEVSQPHPTTTSTLTFNPGGKEVASAPSPKAYRGGRPQTTAQVTFNTSASSVTFLPGTQVTDALPSGADVDPSENVYIDYFILEAIGGEKNISTIYSPMATVTVVIEEGATSFTIEGDRQSEFPAQFLLRVAGSEIYLLAAPTFNGTVTTVNLDQSAPQFFKSDQNNPTLDISSGATRKNASGANPSYFVTESTLFDVIPRGSSSFRLQGDMTRIYTTGVAIFFSDGATFQDYNLVGGSKYDSALDRTVVSLVGNVQSQYGGSITLKRSVRPILPSPAADVFTSRAPLLEQPVTVFRKVEGAIGEILIQGVGYTLDNSGRVVFTDPLTLNEELSVFYTGAEIIDAGRRSRASWSYSIVPSVSNGLLNQVLKMDYSTYIPDTFFYRVETMTNFRAELAQQYAQAAKASSPSQGPILENSSGTRLFKQGNKSLFFDEGDLANQDLVARPTLKYFNDSINQLEDFLKACDGRVVGDKDGRFLFDGNINNPVRANFGAVTNQIDDQVTIFPGVVSQAYKASAVSRFFPTTRSSPGRVTSTPAATGDVFYNTGYKPLTALSRAARRPPFAMVTAPAVVGATVLTVDDANGRDAYFRTAFVALMEVVIVGQNGAGLDATPGLQVLSATATTVTLDAGVAVDIPRGATITLSALDTSYKKEYATNIVPIVNDGLLAYSDLTASLPSLPIPQASDNWDVTVGASQLSPAPFRFPALDGGTSDDDGSIQVLPILTPQANSELAVDQVTGTSNGAGLLAEEALHNTNTLADTNNPQTGVGNFSGTTFTVTSPATFPVTPRRGSLIRWTNGVAGPSSYIRVLSGTATTATLETNLGSGTGVSFLSTFGALSYLGAGVAMSTSGLAFTDTGASFVASGIKPGMTVVVTSGANDLQRRQVASVTSATVLVLVSSFTTVTSNFGYYIETPANTSGLAPTSSMVKWSTALSQVEAAINTEIASLLGYIHAVGTIIAGSSLGSAVTPATFNDATANFTTAQVSTTDYLFIRAGANAGFYSIASVNSATQISIVGSFPSTLGSITYEVLSTTSVSKVGLDTVMTVLKNADAALASIDATQTKLVTVPVINDAGAYATTMEDSVFTARAAVVTARATQAATGASNINAVMSSIDRLYDSRFIWIDARINQEKGILVQQERAVANRKKALENIIKDLTKLLTA
jgi:hypothetical protein